MFTRCGKNAWCSKLGPDTGQAKGLDAGHEDDAVRIAHRDAGDAIGLAADLERSIDDASFGRDRDAWPIEDRLAHVDGRGVTRRVGVQAEASFHARIGVDAQRLLRTRP